LEYTALQEISLDKPTGDDRQLLRHIADGDRQALTELYARYQRLLFNYLLQLTPDYGLAEELVLSTPTSIRIVMFCRLLLVLGYDFALSALASIVVALAHGGSLWEIFQMWLGPMLLLSSITLTLSLLIGSWFAIMAALVLEALQELPPYIERHAPLLHFANPSAWQTSPTVLFLAVLFIIFAVFYAPRQPRLSN